MKKLYLLLFVAAVIGITYVFASKAEEVINEHNSVEATEQTDDTRQESEPTAQETADAGSSSASMSDSYELPSPLSDRPEIIVEHNGYTLSYNKDHNTPNWSAWNLTASKTQGQLGRSTKFYADPKLPAAYSVDYYEYKGSGYDRGHMCPAGDMKWSADAMHDCFYMSNMCPQTHALNDGSWKKLEEACRRWAQSEGAVYIVCGPVYKKGVRHEQIGIDHSIDVPEGFFKAVLSLRKGSEKAIAFYYDNNEVKQPMNEACMSVDEIESLTGIDLFSKLPDDLEQRLESKANIRDWK